MLMDECFDWISYNFYECSRHCFTGYDDSVLRAGRNAILEFVILFPGKFVDEVV